MTERNGALNGAPSQNGAAVSLASRPPSSFFRSARQVFLTALARLRFVAILGAIGVVITQWDTLAAYYEKYERTIWPSAATTADPDSEYFCPMHPTIVRATNKEKCPICFMPLSKRKKGDAADVTLPPGVVSRVQLTPYRVVLAGVKTAPADYVPLTKDVRTVGTVEFDERGLKQVAARYKARIDKLFVNQTGQTVHKGDPLAELYSPDLVVTVQNLLDARAAGNAELQKMTRERLRLWGIGDAELKPVLESGQPITHLIVRSPIDGHVIRKYQTEGRYVEEGTPLFDVADLHTVWLQAEVYEEDLAFLPATNRALSEGERVPVTATTLAFPGEEFPGTLSFVFPHVDPATRTLTVRYDLDNPKHRLRPGMTATVTLKLTPDRLALAGGAFARFQVHDGEVLAVPEGAVIDTGSQKVVYRQSAPGEFDGVRVELGPRMSGPGGAPYYPVLAGLKPEDHVVAAGSFLLDAETRLNPAAGSIYIGGSSGGSQSTAVRPSTPQDPDAKRAAAFAKLSPADRKLAEAQKTCPVLKGSVLGLMGPPVKLTLDGKTVFLCCSNCEPKAKADPAGTAARAANLRKAGTVETAPPARLVADAEAEVDIRAEMAKLPAADRALAEKQRYCPRTGERLGSMGVPVKLNVKGRAVFVCCKGCIAEVQANPDRMLKLVDGFLAGKVPSKK
jgi:multidrug efflux pump subunit AcrA (membrane-fusion protein)